MIDLEIRGKAKKLACTALAILMLTLCSIRNICAEAESLHLTEELYPKHRATRQCFVLCENESERRKYLSYSLNLARKIESKLEQPEEKRGEFATIVCNLNQTGEVSDVRLEIASDNPVFDQCAVRAVTSLSQSPLPRQCEPKSPRPLELRLKFSRDFQINICQSRGVPDSSYIASYWSYFAEVFKRLGHNWYEEVRNFRKSERLARLQDSVNCKVGTRELQLGQTTGAAFLTVARDGSLITKRLEKSSSDQDFDRDALRAIDQAFPLKNLPSEENKSANFMLLFDHHGPLMTVQSSLKNPQKKVEQALTQPAKPVTYYLPDYRVSHLNRLWVNKNAGRGFVSFTYDNLNALKSFAILSRLTAIGFSPPGEAEQSLQDLGHQYPSLLIFEYAAPTQFQPPDSCGASITNRSKNFGKAHLIATTVRKYQIWETDLDVPSGSDNKVMLVKIGDTLLEIYLENVSKKPSAEEWTKLIDSLKEINLLDVERSSQAKP